MRPSDPVPGGKYRLAELQVAIERLLASGAVMSVRRLAWDESVRRVLIDASVPLVTADAMVRSALAGLERLGLVRRVHASEHRHSYTLTDEGIVDLGARSGHAKPGGN